MKDKTNGVCAHSACSCEVAEDQKYCSEKCQHAGGRSTHSFCDCEHDGCTGHSK